MKTLHNIRQRGASIVHWLVALIPLLGFGILAVDMNNLYAAVGELQIVADAGALEGASRLYDSDGNIYPGADTAARDIAESNRVQGLQPDVTVQRGHWQFLTSRREADIERGGVFTPNDTEVETNLVDENGNFKTWQELNDDPDFVNAVRVIAERRVNPVQAFFGSLLGFDSYQAQATAVAYIGFAGSVNAGELDLPIAICRHRLIKDGNANCSVGRLISSSDNDEETGAWTNFSQDPDSDPPQCGPDSASANDIRDLVDDACPPLNPALTFGMPMNVMNGQANTAFRDIVSCWEQKSHSGGKTGPWDATWPDQPWNATLPVIECCDPPGSNNCPPPNTCPPLVGTVSVQILWMVEDESDRNRIDEMAPWQMTIPAIDGDPPIPENHWESGDPIGKNRWDSFVRHFDIKLDPAADGPALWVDPQDENVNNQSGYRGKTIYFSPNCDATEPVGGAGGPNFGILASVPVLVR